VIGQGVSVINKNTQKDSLVFQDTNGGLIFKSSNRDILGDFFR
jgi:hypothetical protein